MLYISTRGKGEGVSASQAVLSSLAGDGGLYVPKVIPTFSYSRIQSMQHKPYEEQAYQVIAPYLQDMGEKDLKESLARAYRPGKFSDPNIAPLKKAKENLFVLELWHGPTAAFKDMALQLLPHLMNSAKKKEGEKRQSLILVATSGDTGKAALEGFKDVEKTRVLVFFPEDGVSELQKRQMVSQKGDNVRVIGVKGNFDDAQKGVKKIFSDPSLGGIMEQAGYMFSSANSINWGRLMPQMVYYFTAYAQLLRQGAIRDGETFNVVVPTGNFGNILAGYYARKMGLPIHRLICASNANRVLADFINTGKYDIRRDFIKTMSPSMDILVSSNLERLLYDISEQDAEEVSDWMSSLQRKRHYQIGGDMLKKIQRTFYGGCADEEDTRKAIRELFAKTGYLMDPHTAVGYHVYQDYVKDRGNERCTVLLSTASPFKFPASVMKALKPDGIFCRKDEFALLKELRNESKQEIPLNLLSLEERQVLHDQTCSPDNMGEMVRELLVDNNE